MSTLADQRVSDREALDPHCLSDEQTDALLAGSPWSRFAVLGDGTADGLGDAVPGYRDLGWADRVTAALQRRRPARFACCNLAERELLVAQVRTTQLEPALAFRPDLVLLVAGGNDIIRRGFDVSDDLLTDYDAIVTTLQGAGADVVTTTVFDVTLSPLVPDERKPALHRRLERLATQIRTVARARGTLHTDLASHPAAGDQDVYSTDVRFASRRGHAIAAAAVIRRLGEHLGNQLDARTERRPRPIGGHLRTAGGDSRRP